MFEKKIQGKILNNEDMELATDIFIKVNSGKHVHQWEKYLSLISLKKPNLKKKIYEFSHSKDQDPNFSLTEKDVLDLMFYYTKKIEFGKSEHNKNDDKSNIDDLEKAFKIISNVTNIIDFDEIFHEIHLYNLNNINKRLYFILYSLYLILRFQGNYRKKDARKYIQKNIHILCFITKKN